MKKIRILSILLVILMIALPVFSACDGGSGGGDDNSSSEEESSSTKKTAASRSNTPGGQTGIPVGFVSYDNFNGYALGTYSGSIAASAAKDGVSYNIVEADNYAEGEEVARALQFYRAALESASATDGFVNITPRASGLADVYVFEVDVMFTEKTSVNFEINGRKAPAGSSAVFNNFIRYTPSSGLLTAGSATVAKLDLNKWYSISLVINDEAQTYDVYLDGYKMLGEVDYVNKGGYPKRSVCEVNLYRITMTGGLSENEFLIDNMAIYKPADETNRPNDYKGNLATTYEGIEMPEIVIFDAETATMEDVYALSPVAAVQKLIGYTPEGGEPLTEGIDIKNGNVLVAVSSDGKDIQYLVDKYGDELATPNPGYTKYLQMDGYASGFNEVKILPKADYFTSLGIKATTDPKGNATWDLSNYSKMVIEFFIPSEVYSASSYYQFLPIVDCSQSAEGWAYYSTAIKTNNSNFVSGNGFYAYEFNITGMGVSRAPTLVNFHHVQFSFSGWSNGVNASAGATSDEFPIYIKSIKLSGGVKVPVSDPAEGMENCTHTLEDETTAYTEEVIVAPSCVNLGYTAVKCSLCGKTTPAPNASSTITAATGHRYGTAEENERDVVYPTCTSGGNAKAPCMDCGIVAQIETYAALGHSYTTKIDTVKRQIRFSCGVCGYQTASNFAESMPTYTELKTAITDAGQTMYRGGIAGVDATIGTVRENIPDGQADTNISVGGIKWIMRGTKVEVLRDILVDENGQPVLDAEGNTQYDPDSMPFARYTWTSRAHSYMELNPLNNKNSDDVVIQMSYRLGPQINGKYPSGGGLQLIDRSTTATAAGGNLFHDFGTIDNGVVTFKTSSFKVPLSETEFTDIAIAFHFANNALDVYVNGVMKAKDIPISNNPDHNMAAFQPDEFRFMQFNGVNKGMTDSWIDIAYVVGYTGSFPVAFTDVELEGVIPDYSGDIVKVDFDGEFDLGADENAYINTNGIASVVDNALVVKNTASEPNYVEFAIDPLKKNSTYIVAIDFKGSENKLVSSALLQGVKGNYYGETLVEDILTVDADGDILFYNQIIGNTAETAKIEIAIDEDKMVLDAYVNGELIATGFYANADYYNVDDQVYLAAFRLVSANGGEYGVDSFNIYTGYYGEE